MGQKFKCSVEALGASMTDGGEKKGRIPLFRVELKPVPVPGGGTPGFNGSPGGRLEIQNLAEPLAMGSELWVEIGCAPPPVTP